MSVTGNLYIITAPSGAGKTTLVRALIKKTPKLVVSVSHITRPKRSREKEGEHYYFVTPEQFESMVDDDEFIEHAKVFDNYYGTSRKFVEQELARGIDVILEIDWQGAELVKKQYPNAISIFILPPTIDALRERLNKRKQDDPEVIERRLSEARLEMSHYKAFDYVVINKTFSVALVHLRAIITAQRLRCALQSEVEQDLIAALL